ncbi:MAG: Trm112 family protein [Chloroflexi bacterium]|nr:Trm112 family protein [Chloroflexota bacterium]
MVSTDLLEILRCPVCVSGPTRRSGDDPGRLDLVQETWLICTENGCRHQYAIRDDSAGVVLAEGAKWVEVEVAN